MYQASQAPLPRMARVNLSLLSPRIPFRPRGITPTSTLRRATCRQPLTGRPIPRPRRTRTVQYTPTRTTTQCTRRCSRPSRATLVQPRCRTLRLWPLRRGRALSRVCRSWRRTGPRRRISCRAHRRVVRMRTGTATRMRTGMRTGQR